MNVSKSARVGCDNEPLSTSLWWDQWQMGCGPDIIIAAERPAYI